MSHVDAPPPGPDFALGVPLADLATAGVLAGHVDGEPVLLSRLHDGIFAVGGACTHYGAALADGLMVDGQVHCPWHHACFDLRTGAALKAPAFAALRTWQVDIVDEQVFVRAAADTVDDEPVAVTASVNARSAPERIVIVGGGAAGFAAAERLRALGFGGTLTMLSADDAAPCDRPNLSKDYLAGTASEDWIPLQSSDFYADKQIDLRLSCEVEAIDTTTRSVRNRSGDPIGYDALLLATGAEPVRLDMPGFDLPNVFTLRSLADARAIIAATADARSAVLIGAGFIGLEVADALRTRGLDVHVVAREQVPMEKVLGPELGHAIVQLHREHGVEFHLGRAPAQFDGRSVTLDDGAAIAADLVIVGVGVRPRTGLAAAAGLAVDNGIVVDAQLQSSMPGVYAAGDVARFRRGPDLLRIEHWVHAERQGQCVAQNMLGQARTFDDVPFFWSHHYDMDIRYVGHAQAWDEVRFEGSFAARDCIARYFGQGRLLAAATVGRDVQNLAIEAELASSLRSAAH